MRGVGQKEERARGWDLILFIGRLRGYARERARASFVRREIAKDAYYNVLAARGEFVSRFMESRHAIVCCSRTLGRVFERWKRIDAEMGRRVAL